MVFIVSLLIFAVPNIVSSAVDNDNLIAVAQLFRHGQRTPVGFYSSDPYRDMATYWGGLPLGALTNEGKRQHLKLGQFTRTRYSNWLPTAYNSSDVRVQTTDVDRTHMSAQANLYGLYPATGNQIWKSGVNWQPIPIHPADPNALFSGTSSCLAYKALLANVTSEEEYVTLNSTYASMYAYIAENTGAAVTSIYSLLFLYDSFLIEEQVGYELPSWTSAVYPEPLATLAGKFYEMYSYTTQMKRFIVGLFLNNLVEYFEEMAADASSSQKLQIFSAHDANVYSVLHTLGNKPDKPVPFAVSLWFELRKVNFINVVNLWMKSGDDFTQLTIAGCALDCPLTKLRTLLSDYILDADTYAAECNNTT